MTGFHRHIAKVAALAGVLAVLVRVRALAAGFVLDDFVHMAMARNLFPLQRAAWDLFSFVRSPDEIERGIVTGALPWWTDPDLRLAFLRPISSLLTAFDGRVIGPNAALQHVHSLAWLIALVAAVTTLAFRILPARAAVFASIAFACEEALTTPLAWVANRSALVASTFAVLALVAWTYRADSRRARIACEVLTAAAVLSGEYGLGVLFMRAGLALADRQRPLRSRGLEAGALAGVLALYTYFHRLAGYGVASFPLYRDPTGDLAGYLQWSTEQLRRLVQDLVIALPTSAPPTPLATAIALAVLALVALLALRAGAFAALGLLGGGLIALLPLASSIAHTRLLVLPAVGASAVIGAALDHGLTTVRSPAASGVRRALLGAALALVAFVHGPQAALRSAAEVGRAPQLNTARIASILDAPVGPSDRMILMSAGDPTTILYFPQVRTLFGRSPPAAFNVLTASPFAQRVTRIDDRTLEIDMPRSGLLATPLASVMRAPDKGLPVGAVVRAQEMTVTVLARGALGPSRVRFAFSEPLDAPNVRTFVSRPHGFEPFVIPPIGASVGLPPAADPSEAK